MTEAAASAVLVDLGEAAATCVSLWASFTFAYITVAYFVGKSLSRFQCVAISVLYSATALFFANAAVVYVYAWHLFKARERTVFDEVWLVDSPTGWVGGAAFFLLAGTLVSLYFMYNVRQSHKE